MADKYIEQRAADLTLVRVPLHENADGSYSPGVSISDGVETAKGTRTHSTAAPTNTAVSVLAANSSRKEALIRNNGTQTVYLGKDNTVTTSNGLPLLVGETLTDDRTTEAWWAIVASGTGDLRIVEVA